MNFLTMVWEWLRSHALSMPSLAKFALAMAIIVGILRYFGVHGFQP